MHVAPIQKIILFFSAKYLPRNMRITRATKSPIPPTETTVVVSFLLHPLDRRYIGWSVKKVRSAKCVNAIPISMSMKTASWSRSKPMAADTLWKTLTSLWRDQEIKNPCFTRCTVDYLIYHSNYLQTEK